MIIQGLMMNFWFDQQTTIQSLASDNQLVAVFEFILSNIKYMENDFEIKRLIIGLSTLTMSPQSNQLDAIVQQNFEQFMKAILYLCQKSLEIREKKQKKVEEALEDKDCEKGVIYDEDEDEEASIDLGLDCDDDDDDNWDPESDDDELPDMYETKFDKVDDVLFVKETLGTLQAQNQSHYSNILSILNEVEQQSLQQMFNQAQIYQDQKIQLEAQIQMEKAQNAQNCTQVALWNRYLLLYNSINLENWKIINRNC